MKTRGVGIAVAVMTQVAAAQGLPLPAQPPPSADLTRVLARWAPDVYQDVDDSAATADLLTAMDFDGDVDMTNNWESLEGRGFDDLLRAGVVYTWATRTATHDFLGYGFFHPRDWHDADGRLVRIGRRLLGQGSGEHENDMEGLLLVVDRARNEPVLLVTQAHGEFWQYGESDDWRQRPKGTGLRSRYHKREDIDGPIRRDPVTGRVQVFVQAEGHGVYGSPSKTHFDGVWGDGVLYTRGGARLIRPREGAHVTDYALESITPWWNRFEQVPDGGADATFNREDRRGPGRKLGVPPTLAFSGDTQDKNSANPPWGWRDSDYPHSLGWKFFTAPQEFVHWAFAPTSPYARRALSQTFPPSRTSPFKEVPRRRAPRTGAAGALGRRVR